MERNRNKTGLLAPVHVNYLSDLYIQASLDISLQSLHYPRSPDVALSLQGY